MMPEKCPNCGTSKEYFEVEQDGWRTYCGGCWEEIDEINADGAPAPEQDCSHWIVGGPAKRSAMSAEELAAHRERERIEEGKRLEERLNKIRAANDGKIPVPPRDITDDRLYTG